MAQERSAPHNERRVAVLVPIKDFNAAKDRLSSALQREQRSALARQMAATVIAAADPLDVYVVCDDDGVASWCDRHGANVIRTTERGLNPSVTAGVAELESRGTDMVIISHGDLPLATSYAGIADFAGVTIVPDRHGEGTNVMCVPSGVDFTFGYGPGSFTRHAAEAKRLGLPVRVFARPSLQHDVDTPDDLAAAGITAPTDSTAERR